MGIIFDYSFRVGCRRKAVSDEDLYSSGHLYIKGIDLTSILILHKVKIKSIINLRMQIL